MDSAQAHELYVNLFKTIPDPFFVVSEDGTYLDVLGGAERSLYDDVTSFKGRNIRDFTESSFADFFMNQVKATLDASQLNCFEYQLENSHMDIPEKNGPSGLQWFEARLYPLEHLYDGKRAVTAMVINISERKLLQQRLRDLSYLDPLTSVANRRYFLERMSEELEDYDEEKNPVSVMILDIDHFKQINDSLGHLAGDQVLKDLVQVIRQQLRRNDNIARFGGDEFIVSMTNTTLDQAIELASQVRSAVGRQEFSYEGKPLSLTVSIGVASATMYDADESSIIRRADKALYLAKENGRNRVKRG